MSAPCKINTSNSLVNEALLTFNFVSIQTINVKSNDKDLFLPEKAAAGVEPLTPETVRQTRPPKPIESLNR